MHIETPSSRFKASRRVDSLGLHFAGPPSLRLRRKEGRENKSVKSPLSASRIEGRQAQRRRGESIHLRK